MYIYVYYVSLQLPSTLRCIMHLGPSRLAALARWLRKFLDAGHRIVWDGLNVTPKKHEGSSCDQVPQLLQIASQQWQRWPH